VVYKETHNVARDKIGYFNLVIGRGSTNQGYFSNINWENNTHWTNIEMDSDNSEIFGYIGFNEFLSVPFANYSLTSDHGLPGIQGPMGPTGATGPTGVQGPSGREWPRWFRNPECFEQSARKSSK